MLDAELLKILADPKTKEPLHLASPDEVSRANAAIAKGTKTAGGEAAQPVTEGLVPQSGERLYPIRDGIPVLLFDESIPLR